MDFILEWWKALLALGLTVVGAGGLSWVRNTFISKAAHDKHRDELERRLTAVETTIAEMPSAKDIHELDKRLIEVSVKIDGLTPQLRDIKRLTDLLMENELRGNRHAD